MAKRFIDSELFNDEDFQEFTIEGKLLFIYYITKCNHAGVFKINSKLADFQTGIKDSINLMRHEMRKMLIELRDGYLFMPKYIFFQYPNFPKSGVKQQESALKILKDFGINELTLNSYLTVRQELPNSYDNDNDNVYNNNINNNKKEKIKNKKENENQIVTGISDCNMFIISNLRDKAKAVYETMSKDEVWLSATCKGFSLPFNREKNFEWLLKKLYVFLNQRISEGAIAVSDRELKRHFLNWCRYQVDNDVDIKRLKNISR